MKYKVTSSKDCFGGGGVENEREEKRVLGNGDVLGLITFWVPLRVRYMK